MRNTATLVLLFSVSGFAFGAFPCVKVDYAELKDMSTAEQAAYYCKVKDFDARNNADSMSMVNRIADGNTSVNGKDMEENRIASEGCQTAMESVSRLLHRKQISPDAIECENGKVRKQVREK